MSSETNETQRASQPTEIDILRQEVRNQSADDIAQEAENTLQKVQELKIILQSSKKIIHQFEGTADDKESAKGKAVDVKRVVQKILLASIDNKIPVPDGADPQVQDFARLVIQKIGQHIGVENVTELTAPSLHEFLYKVVTGEITDIDSLVQEFNNIRLLSVYSSELHKNLKNAMISIAKEKGLSEEEAGEKFNILNDENKIEAYRQFSQDKWDEFSKAEQKILFALYTPEGFNDFIEEEKERIRRLTQSVGLSEEQISQKASIDIENKIMGILSRPLLKLDRGYADQSYEEIVKRDIWKGIEVTLTRLEKVLEKLQTDIQQDKVLKYKKGVYAKKEDIFYEMQQRVEDGESPEKILQMLPERQTSPFFKKEEILLSDYAHKLLLNFKVYQQIREYTHNVNAIFHRNPGKEGFYDQLANYSGRISTLIMDEINLQPDAELYRAAYQLYDKYIEEDFAAVNWIHQTTQFRASPGEAHTFVQRDIVKKLEIMFPDIKLDNPDRIISAVNIATGAARGIYMTHPEKQAYADPNLTLKGDPTFSSYSDRDAYGLIALNPQHLIYRFQAEGLMPSIFFIPIDHLEQGITWDHERLKDKIEKYKETFLKGRKGAGLSEKIFMDYLMNIGKVGGPIARAGWRIENMYRHHIRYVDGNFQLGEVDYLESWKNLENIGFHVLHDFVGGEGRHKYLKDDDFNKDLSDSESDDKKALFGYIFTKYFRDEKGEPRELSDLETYYSSLLEQAKKNAYKEIEEGKIYPEKLNEAINLEASNIFLYQTLARVVAQRIPTKLIRLERNRMSEDGERAWEKIRIQFRDNHSDDLNIDKNPIIFQEAVRNIMFAETIM